MLILSRKSGEEIHIGSGIRVSVLGINGSRVRLGLSAPPEVSIRRAELRHAPGASAQRPADDSPRDAERPEAVCGDSDGVS
jgi:carbon storage regulator